MQCPYCNKRPGILPIASHFGAVDICLSCATEHQKRLGIRQDAINEAMEENLEQHFKYGDPDYVKQEGDDDE